MDYILGARAASGDSQDRESADAILNAVLKQIEKRESESAEISVYKAEATASANTIATDS